MPGGSSASFGYDADGRRVKQTQGGNNSNYLWDEFSAYGDVLLETDGTGAVQTSYILGKGELLSQKKSGVVNYLLKDGQGSTRNLVDSTGNLVSGQSYSYDAFGKLLSGQTSPASNYLYTGQQFDTLSGLYSLRARYYNPGDGRFLSQDTHPQNLNNPIELNRYGYTADNPINASDPSGLGLVEFAINIGNSLKDSHKLLPLATATYLYLLFILARIKAISISDTSSGDKEADGVYYFYHDTTVNDAKSIVAGLFDVNIAHATTLGVGFYTFANQEFSIPRGDAEYEAMDSYAFVAEEDNPEKGSAAVVELAMLKSVYKTLKTQVKFDTSSFITLNTRAVRSWTQCEYKTKTCGPYTL